MRRYEVMNRLVYGAIFFILFVLVFGSINIMFGFTGADVDGNDDYNNAEEITVGKTTGSLSETDTSDFYKVQLTSGSIVTITFSGDIHTWQDLYFMNPAKEQIFALYSTEGSEETDSYYLAVETSTDYWYIEVSGDPGSYQFQVSTATQNDAGTGGDVYSDYDNAHEVDNNIEYSGHMEDLDESDMYKTKIEGNCIITVDFAGDIDEWSDLYLLSPTKEEIFPLYSTEASEESDSYYLANETTAGYYYINIKGIGDYTFKVTITKQNDANSGSDVAENYAAAYEIKRNIEYTGHVEDIDTTDMYKLNLSSGENISIKFNGDMNDWHDLVFYNPSKVEVFVLYSTDGSEETNSYIVPSGIATDYWYIKIVGSVGDYKFKTTVTEGPTAKVPSTPLNLQASAGDGEVTLSWNTPSDTGGVDITGYKIYRGNISGKLTLLTTIDTGTSYTDNTVTNEITYYYQVSAVNSAGEGQRSSEALATPEPEEEDDGDDEPPGFCLVALVLGMTLIVALIYLSRK